MRPMNWISHFLKFWCPGRDDLMRISVLSSLFQSLPVIHSNLWVRKTFWAALIQFLSYLSILHFFHMWQNHNELKFYPWYVILENVLPLSDPLSQSVDYIMYRSKARKWYRTQRWSRPGRSWGRCDASIINGIVVLRWSFHSATRAKSRCAMTWLNGARRGGLCLLCSLHVCVNLASYYIRLQIFLLYWSFRILNHVGPRDPEFSSYCCWV